MARTRFNHVTVGIAATLLLVGCGSASSPQSAAPSAAANDVRAPAAASPSPRVTASATGGDGPAGMVCGDEIRGQVGQILGLPGKPNPTAAEKDGRYTCTYETGSGPLVLSVQKSASQAAAKAYFDSIQPTLANVKPIEGLANLGLPASETPDGVVMFVKDDMTLTVDASGLPKSVGPHGVAPAAVAYQLATDVIACWTDH